MENIICDIDYIYGNNNNATVMEIQHGLKIRVNKVSLDSIQDNKSVTDKFKLNIKRLNRWYYSVYFDRKE